MKQKKRQFINIYVFSILVGFLCMLNDRNEFLSATWISSSGSQRVKIFCRFFSVSEI